MHMYDKYKPPSEQQFQRRDKGYSDASTKWNHDRYFDLERERKQERNQRLDREYDRRHTDRQNTDRQNIINSERSRNTKQEPKYDKNQERSESNSFHHPRHNNDNNNSRDQLQRPTPSKRHREDERHHEPTRAPSQNRDRDRNQDHTDSKFNRYYRDERGDGAKRELHERIRIRSMSRQPIIRRANVRIESYTSSYSSSTPSSAPLGKRCSYDDRSNQDERTEKRKESSIRQQDNNRSRNDYDSSKYK